MLAFMPFMGAKPPGFLLGSLESCVPLTLCPNFPGAGLAYLAGVFGIGAPPIEGRAPSCGFRMGDSGRGREGLAFLDTGLAALPGPTD